MGLNLVDTNKGSYICYIFNIINVKPDPTIYLRFIPEFISIPLLFIS